MTSSVFSNNNNAAMISSLPSPPISNRQSTSKMPAFMLDRAPSPSSKCCNRSLVSNIGSTNELRPLLYQQQDECCLPPIQNVVFLNTPTSSPSSPPSSCYYSSSPASSIESPSTPSVSDEEDLLNSSSRRKGSIALLLNSDPELKQLDEEESKCNYQSHFFDNYSSKRPRPSSAVPIDDIVVAHKKQRIDTLDCVKQACRSPVSNTMARNESTRAAKGLRHFSKQVCDKVAKKGITTYNEVADELTFDIQQHATADGQQKQAYDQKNIRRRVYDALNVLMAMNIIAKDKKVIKWLGIPDCYRQHNKDQDRSELLNLIKAEELRSRQLLGSLQMLRSSVNSKLEKHVQIRNLVGRNQSQSSISAKPQQKLKLPFFMICASGADSLHTDIQKDTRSAVISFQSHCHGRQAVYKDIDILRHVSLLS
ncbi:E2F/DP family winged-helix DNA-binding domain-containing protein [Parasitella parasitica]|nr:E2F/DP family winged-helix DNA-binding domain-containing protein [Parasitella parasitica]